MQNHQAGWHTISFEPLLDITPFQISASPPLAKQCDPIFLTLPVRSSTAGIVFVDWGMQLDSDCTDIQIPDTLVIVAVHFGRSQTILLKMRSTHDYIVPLMLKAALHLHAARMGTLC